MYEYKIKEMTMFLKVLSNDLKIDKCFEMHDERDILEIISKFISLLSESRAENKSFASARDLAIANNHIARVLNHLQAKISNEFVNLQLENIYNE